MKKLLLVGDRPSSKNTDPTIAFVGTPSFLRLQRLLQIANISQYELCNAFDANGQPLPIPDAQVTVALGANASKQLSAHGITHHYVPHPSPRNRFWNKADAEQLVANKLASIARKGMN